ncbi:family 1 glycosylhydrolase, partial [Saccharothrix sp. MB29]|nr:family 1 glycosylhydrolase [Saccharothrix sp. MB29]
LYADPVLAGRYPDSLADRLPVRDGDLDVIRQPIDVLGVNYYSSAKHSGTDENGNTADADGLPVGREVRFGAPVTAMDWEIVPE